MHVNKTNVTSDLVFDDTSRSRGDLAHTKWHRFGPPGLVTIVVALGLWELSAETAAVPYPNDSSVHEEMALFAAHLFANGHFPLDSWYPFLGLGSSQFLHYQSLGAMLTGLVGIIFGANVTFAWSLYLLLATWPISIYLSARLFGCGRWPSAFAACIAPLIVSSTGVGYGQIAYLFTGFGVWTQLWGMWTLPLAWAFSWRAVHERRYVMPAVVFVALTAAFHFITGYLAFLPILLWPFIQPSEFLRRLGRAMVIFVGSLLVSAWVILPLFVDSKWASLNEFLQNTPGADSYGARQVLRWLVDGNTFDYGHFPIITLFVGIGFIACIARFRRDVRARALACLFVVSVVAYFGRPTLGPIINLLPGSHDLFLRRFLIGVQLSGLYLAGVGMVAAYELGAGACRRFGPSIASAFSSRRLLVASRRVAIVGLFVIVLAPAWTQTNSTDISNGQSVSYQTSQDAVAGAQLNVIISRIQALGGGRTYAGLDQPGNWGLSFSVGNTPVFKYLASKEIPELGYTLRTASLMSNAEAYFDESDPADYSLFAVRYIILPSGDTPPVPAHRILRSGPYSLWSVNSAGYVQVIDTITPLIENRADIGAQSSSFVRSDLASEGIYPTVAYDGQPAAAPTVSPGATPTGSPGTVVNDSVDLESGYVRATVVANRTAVVLLKASFDPGWTVTVDGVDATPEMIAPAYVGVAVTPGTHTVVFAYKGYPYYPELFGLAGLTLVGLALSPRILKRLRARKHT